MDCISATIILFVMGTFAKDFFEEEKKYMDK